MCAVPLSPTCGVIQQCREATDVCVFLVGHLEMFLQKVGYPGFMLQTI